VAIFSSSLVYLCVFRVHAFSECMALFFFSFMYAIQTWRDRSTADSRRPAWINGEHTVRPAGSC
jgi:hypothetical protein